LDQQWVDPQQPGAEQQRAGIDKPFADLANLLKNKK
jgi:hypothetical protein